MEKRLLSSLEKRISASKITSTRGGPRLQDVIVNFLVVAGWLLADDDVENDTALCSPWLRLRSSFKSRPVHPRYLSTDVFTERANYLSS